MCELVSTEVSFGFLVVGKLEDKKYKFYLGFRDSLGNIHKIAYFESREQLDLTLTTLKEHLQKCPL